MASHTRVAREELTASEIIEVLEGGGRVLIETSVLGRETTVVVREQNGTYYCDTPMKLLTHENPEDLGHCLEKFRLAKRDGVEDERDSSELPV